MLSSTQIVLWSVSLRPLILYIPSSSISISVTKAAVSWLTTTKSMAEISFSFFVFFLVILPLHIVVLFKTQRPVCWKTFKRSFPFRLISSPNKPILAFASIVIRISPSICISVISSLNSDISNSISSLLVRLS